MNDLIKTRIRWRLDSLIRQVPAIAQSVSGIISEVSAIRVVLGDLEDAYEDQIKLLKLEIENLKEKQNE